MTRVAVIHHGSYLGMERREGPLHDSELLKQGSSLVRLLPGWDMQLDIILATSQNCEVANKLNNSQRGSVGAWAKRCYFAGRAAIEAVLPPYDLGATQWYVLYQLAHDGPTMERDLLRMLQVERATLELRKTSDS